MTGPISLLDQLHADVRALGLDPDGAGEGGRALSSATLSRLLEYATLLQRWNAKIRLVGPSDLPTIVREQLVDALGFVHALADLDAPDFWDIGAGGGLPGLPLAIAFPDRRFVMVEPIHKKTAFLSHAVHALGLTNVRVHTGRAEADGKIAPPLRPALHEPPRAALSRATLGPSEWLATARELVGPGGLVLIAIADAASMPASVLSDATSTPAGQWAWTLPATGAPRTLVARRVTANPA